MPEFHYPQRHYCIWSKSKIHVESNLPLRSTISWSLSSSHRKLDPDGGCRPSLVTTLHVNTIDAPSGFLNDSATGTITSSHDASPVITVTHSNANAEFADPAGTRPQTKVEQGSISQLVDRNGLGRTEKWRVVLGRR